MSIQSFAAFAGPSSSFAHAFQASQFFRNCALASWPSSIQTECRKKPRQGGGVEFAQCESDLLQGALSIRLEVIGPTWRCIKQTRDVRVLLWGKAPAPDRLRPAEPTQHCRVHSWMGCASWRCCRASWSGRRARCGSRRVRARPRSNHGSMRAGRCVRASRSPSGLCRAAHV